MLSRGDDGGEPKKLIGIARRLVSGGRDDDAIRRNAAAAGLRVELKPEPATEVWPDNWAVMEVAVRMLSQLNVGMAGVVGMRYEALPVIFDVLEVPQAERRCVLDGLRVVEGEVVRLINEKR